MSSVSDRIKRRRLPNVDAPKVTDQSLRQWAEGIKEHLRMYEGDSGAPKERFVTLEELEASGLVTLKLQQKFATISEVGGQPVPVAVSTRPSQGAVTPGTGSGSGSSTLAELTDTSVSGVSANDYLMWNGAAWVGAAVPAIIAGNVDSEGATNTWVLTADGVNGAAWAAGPIAGQIIGDITTATPPVHEAITALVQYWDSDETDLIGSIGFNARNDLEFTNFMTDGDIIFTQDNSIGTASEVARFVGGTSGGVDEFFRTTAVHTLSRNTHAFSKSEPGLAIGGTPNDGSGDDFLGLWHDATIQHYTNDLSAGGTLQLNPFGGNVTIGGTGGGSNGGVSLYHNNLARLVTSTNDVFIRNDSATAPSTGTVGGDISISLVTNTNSLIAEMGVRASLDDAFFNHSIHGQPWTMWAQNSGGSDKRMMIWHPDDGISMSIPDTSTAGVRTASVVNGLLEINTDGAGTWARVLTSTEVGGGSNTSWSTGGGSTYETGSTTALESGAVQTFQAGAILEIEEANSMTDPAAGFGRVWMRDAVPNVLAVTNDVGDDYDLETTIRKTESVVTTNVITALESGTTFYLNLAAGFTSTLPAPAAGLHFTFIVATAPTTSGGYVITTNAGANVLEGMFLDIVGELQAIAAQDTLTFVFDVSLVGDRLKVESDGTSWFCTAFSKADGGITVSVT